MNPIVLCLAAFICVVSLVCGIFMLIKAKQSNVRERLLASVERKAISAGAYEPLGMRSPYDDGPMDKVFNVLLAIVRMRAKDRTPGLRTAAHRILLTLLMLVAAVAAFFGGMTAIGRMYLGAPLTVIFSLAAVWAAMRVTAVYWVDWHTARWNEEINYGLIDMLDLWVLCLGAGMSFQSAMVRLSQDEQFSSPALRDELQITIQEMLAGAPREQALKNLVRRCGGSSDMRALVSQIIQSERLGSSLGNTLRIFADSLRFKRRQDAQEMIQKMPIKIAFPLVFFILPALFVVILGPSVIRTLEVLF